jgi:crotonobetainyl-CoA:carnitine CoA-transferase CaiB-like acyl-CoA transferase
MINDALRTLLPIAGWNEAHTNDLEITGGYDPVIKTPFRVTETAVAALGAIGLAVNDLWELRTGRRQHLTIDTRRATASLRSSFYIKLENEVVSNARNQVMGFYPAKHGRWSYIHANFPNHREIALKLLGVPENRDAVKKAVAQWDALELEEAIVAAKGVGGMVRSIAEWAEHPQGKAIAALPTMEIIKIGDAPAEPLKPGKRPLSGVRVVDVTRVIAGPTCARTLAEHGAEVMKISAAHLPHLGRQELDTGHGKLSAQLDLREQKDVATLQQLVRGADIFSQGYRPGTIGARGFSPEALHALRPGIIAVSLCAFSHAGPWATRRGFDTVVQSVSGITHRQGEVFPGAEPGPQFYPSSAIDFLTGYLMCFGACVALKRRALEGGSWHVRISLAQAGRWLMQRGQVDASELHRAVSEFTPAEIEAWTTTSTTPRGKLWHLAPVTQMSETPPHWDKPTVPLGYHAPVWPA